MSENGRVQHHSYDSFEFRSQSFPSTTYGGWIQDYPPSKSKGLPKLKEGKKHKSSSSWDSWNDPELKRKKRVASYKVFTVEHKVKSSVRNSFKWIKDKYIEMRYGWF